MPDLPSPDIDPNQPNPNDPFAQPAFEPVAPTPDPWVGEQQKEQYGKLKQAQAAEEAAMTVKSEQMVRPRAELMAEMSFRPPAPKLEPYRDPPDVRVNDADEFKKYFMPMAVFAMLLGRFMRADAVDGLNMLSAGMRGYHEGRVGYANHMIEQWKNKMQKVQRENQRRLDEYQAIINDRNSTLQEKQVRMNLIAAQNDDAIMMAQLKKGNIQDTLKQLNQMATQQDKFIRTQVYYQNAVSARAARLQAIEQQRLNREERAREFDERMAAAADKDVTKFNEKFAKVYNDSVGKILAAGRSSMQQIMRNPYLQMRKDWQESAVNALANDLAGEMAYANNRLRASNMPVDPRNEALEDAGTMKTYLLLGPAAVNVVNMGRVTAPSAPPPGQPAPSAPAAEGAVIPDQ